MNLWVNRVRQVAVLALALFFFACEDESSILGFKNPNSRFKVYYAEIPVESSVMLIDSVRSSIVYQADQARMMSGRYSDPALGNVSVTGFTRFFPTTSTKLATTAVFDSIAMEMRMDYYAYGANNKSVQTFTVHEVLEKISYTDGKDYFTSSNVSYSPTPLATQKMTVDLADFRLQDEKTNNPDTFMRFTLDNEFGQRLFLVAQNNTNNALDTLDKFMDFFKGLAIVPDNANDKVLGFTPTATKSKITLYYHTPETDSLVLNFTFASGGAFSKVSNDRTTVSDLASLTNNYTPYTPPSGKRYLQSGGRLVTRVNFNKFIEFMQADSNKNIMINSAELNISGIDDPGVYLAPNSLAVLQVRSNNRFKYFKNKQDTTDFTGFGGLLTIHAGDVSSFGVTSDAGQLFIMSLKNNTYNGFLTRFAQNLYSRRNDQSQFLDYALVPVSPASGRSMNRLVFPAENLKMKIFYTVPTIKSNQ